MLNASFPQPNEEAARRLEKEGYTNTLYEELTRPATHLPRTWEHKAYTYTIMAISGLSYFYCYKHGYNIRMMSVAFCLAPIYSFFQVRDADYFHQAKFSFNSNEQLAEEFRVASINFKKVLSDVEEEIQKHKDQLKWVEEEIAKESSGLSAIEEV